MDNITDLIAELDRIASLPVRDRPAEKLLIFRRVEAALRDYAMREEAMRGSASDIVPVLSHLSSRILMMERLAPAVPPPDLVAEYYAAAASVRRAISNLQKAIRGF